MTVSSHPAQAAGRVRFPWAYVLRWLVGTALFVHGLYSLYGLSLMWEDLADKAIIDPGYAPLRFLPAALLKPATGLALLLRSRFAILLAAGWLLAFLFMFSGEWGALFQSPLVAASLAQVLLVLALTVFLWSKRLLR